MIEFYILMSFKCCLIKNDCGFILKLVYNIL